MSLFGNIGPKLNRQLIERDAPFRVGSGNIFNIRPKLIDQSLRTGVGRLPTQSNVPSQTVKLPNVNVPTQTVSQPAPSPTVRPTSNTPPIQAPTPAPYSGGGGRAPFAASVKRVETGLDPITKQLLFGLDGKGGFIPGAMRAAEQGQPVVIEEKVAGLTPDQIRAQELARSGVGIQDRFLGDAETAYRTGVSSLGLGLDRARGLGLAGLGVTRAGLGSLLSGIGESEGLIRGTLGAYDPRLTGQFYNPFEQQVVQQTISDI